MSRVVKIIFNEDVLSCTLLQRIIILKNYFPHKYPTFNR